MLLSGDPKMELVPQALINWAIKSVVQTFMGQMKAEAENNSERRKMDPKRAEFIKDMDAKVKQMLLNKEALEPHLTNAAAL